MADVEQLRSDVAEAQASAMIAEAELATAQAEAATASAEASAETAAEHAELAVAEHALVVERQAEQLEEQQQWHLEEERFALLERNLQEHRAVTEQMIPALQAESTRLQSTMQEILSLLNRLTPPASHPNPTTAEEAPPNLPTPASGEGMQEQSEPPPAKAEKRNRVI